MPDSRVAMRRTRPLKRSGPTGRDDSVDPAKDDSAFTVTELAVVVAGLALLFITALPLLGNVGLRSERLVCGNNLRQVGVAFQTWSDSHDNFIPGRCLLLMGAQGGLPSVATRGINFFQFQT